MFSKMKTSLSFQLFGLYGHELIINRLKKSGAWQIT